MSSRAVISPKTLLAAVLGLALNVALAHADPRELPLLGKGSYLGMIVGFDKDLPAETRKQVDIRWKEAISKGMRIGHIHVGWDQLNPKPGEYNKGLLEERLLAMKKDGLRPFVTLETLDSDSLSLPRDLIDPTDAKRIAGGKALDDAELLARFAGVLDWAVPMIVANGGWALSVANEPDSLFEEYPFYAQQMGGFVAAARKHVRTLNPDLAVTVTLTGQGYKPSSASWAKPIIAECDVACFNYYPLGHNTLQVEPFTIESDIAAMVKAADGRNVMIQELGCPAGYEDKPSSMNATLEKQRAFFEQWGEAMAKEPKLRAATMFQLVDWSPQLTDAFMGVFLDSDEEGAKVVGQRLGEWLKTSGLLRYSDGSARPAWSTFLKAVERVAQTVPAPSEPAAAPAPEK